MSRPRVDLQGREIVLGVRAEHITIGADGVPARVLVVEPLGSHALVTALVGKTAVKVQAPIDVGVRPDQAINLRFDEATVLRIADGYEQAAGFASLRPPTSHD